MLNADLGLVFNIFHCQLQNSYKNVPSRLIYRVLSDAIVKYALNKMNYIYS